jgi:hypothetical protein
MKTYRLITLCILCALLILLTGVAWARTAQNSLIDRSVIGSGGAYLEQGVVSLDNTLGQPVVGSYSDGNADLCVGFWCQIAFEYNVYIPLVLKNENS